MIDVNWRCLSIHVAFGIAAGPGGVQANMPVDVAQILARASRRVGRATGEEEQAEEKASSQKDDSRTGFFFPFWIYKLERSIIIYHQGRIVTNISSQDIQQKRQDEKESSRSRLGPACMPSHII